MKVGVISDIHGNHLALEQVLTEARRQKVEKLLILGDVVGYYYHPSEVMTMLNAWDYELIKGNHEAIMMEVAAGNNVETVTSKYGSAHLTAIQQLSSDQFTKLTEAPSTLKVEMDGVSFLMCHGSNWNPDYYVYPDASAEVLRQAAVSETDFVLIGHSHYQFAVRTETGMLLNVGSAGQSRSKGGLADWAVINTANKSFELKSTPYDPSLLIAEAARIDPDVAYLQTVLKRTN